MVNLRVAMFSLSFSFGCANNLGICEATKDSSGESSKNRENKAAFGGALELGQPLCGAVT